MLYIPMLGSNNTPKDESNNSAVVGKRIMPANTKKRGEKSWCFSALVLWLRLNTQQSPANVKVARRTLETCHVSRSSNSKFCRILGSRAAKIPVMLDAMSATNLVLSISCQSLFWLPLSVVLGDN